MSPMAIFFTMTTLTAAIDFILACSLLGKTEILKFYMVHGKRVCVRACVRACSFGVGR